MEPRREVLKIKEFKFRPSKHEKELLTQLFATYEAAYNKLLDLIYVDIIAIQTHMPTAQEIGELVDQWWGVTQDQYLTNFLPISHLLVPQ